MWSTRKAAYAKVVVASAAVFVLIAAAPVSGQTPGWLRYGIPPDPPRYHDLPHAVVVLGNAAEEITAAQELDRGVGHMLGGTDIVLHRFDSRVDAIVLGTSDALRRSGLHRLTGWTDARLPEEGYRILHLRSGIRQWYVLEGGSPRAELWAAFRFNTLIAEDQQLPEHLVEIPQLAMRGLELREDGDSRALLNGTSGGLLRLMASVGLNTLILDTRANEVENVAAEGRRFGMHVWVRANAMDAQDLDRAKRLTAVPNVEGVVVAVPTGSDLEHLRFALTSANTLLKSLRSKGRGVMVQDFLGEALPDSQGRQLPSVEDRASLLQRVGLDSDVIVTEPAISASLPLSGIGSPNFGLLAGRAQAARFELFGAPLDVLAYPAQVWQRVLQTPERQTQRDGVLLDSVRLGGSRGGVIATASVQAMEAMMRQPMLQANLYAFGRVSWNPAAHGESLAEEWSRLTWGDDARVYRVTTNMLLHSAELLRRSTSPLGLAPLSGADGYPHPSHVSIAHGKEAPTVGKEAWGTDRTASGTDEVRHYPEAFAAELTSLAQCPEDWLLAFHRVPYTFKLRDGKTSVQEFYDVHFAAAAQIANIADAWDEVDGLVDDVRFKAVHAFLVDAALQAEIWRDTTTEWLQRLSGIKDELGFVGHHPGRIEAEDMDRTGWVVQQTDKPEDASAGAYVRCQAATCLATTSFNREENVYRVEVGYLASSGVTFSLIVNGVPHASWTNNASDGYGGESSKVRRFVANGLRLKRGDKIQVVAQCEARQTAYLDFVDVTRDPRWN